jgi:deoxyribose-phosphate aldolase
MKQLFEKYSYKTLANENIELNVSALAAKSNLYKTEENLKLLFSLIDLTSLGSEDNANKIKLMTTKVNELNKNFPNMPNVAAICVYPSMVEHVKSTLAIKNIGIASVGGGFPSSQTFLNIKVDECKQAIDAGATEIDIVLSIGRFFEGDYDYCFKEIKNIKAAIGHNHLKVILESGALKSHQQIWEASILAMEAGADFIKTSTGKQNPAATTDAMYVMTKAIKAFYDNTGKKIGIKPAGGIVTTEDALNYYSIVKENLGNDWLNSELFRLGASRLANNLLSEITHGEISYF